MKVKLRTKLAVFMFAILGVSGLAIAIVEFDDIALDGGGPGQTPFIRFDDSGTQKFIVGFSDRFAFWAGSSYSLNIYDNAATNSINLRNGNVGIFNSNPATDVDIDGNVMISGNLELGSSRSVKQDIKALSLSAAQKALDELNPVTFKYLHSPEENSLGFIAEDVPDLVASQTRLSIKPMDMVAVLTKVVQEQQKTIDDLSQKVSLLCNDRKC